MQKKDVIFTSELRDKFGEVLELLDEGSPSEPYRILSEFYLGGRGYAVLQSESLSKEGEVAIFRVTRDEQNEPALETIEDDDEWEEVAEIYDEMAFPVEEP